MTRLERYAAKGRETYVRKVMKDMIATMPYLRPDGQLVGFSGSSGPSQSTRFGSLASSCFSSSTADKLLLSPVSASAPSVSDWVCAEACDRLESVNVVRW